MPLGDDQGQYMSGKDVFEAQVGSLGNDADRLRQYSSRYVAKLCAATTT